MKISLTQLNLNMVATRAATQKKCAEIFVKIMWRFKNEKLEVMIEIAPTPDKNNDTHAVVLLSECPDRKFELKLN